ncbi:MAG: transcription-repair coupling factor [Actinobacteria bacterium]|nr:transcription-repair coupling factor [Actinomycetota bacterium]
MRGLLPLISQATEIAESVSVSGTLVAPAAIYPFLIALRAQERPLIVVTSSSRAAEDLASELRTLHENVFEFPAWETLPHERLSPRSDTVAKRIHVLYQLEKQRREGLATHPVIITPSRGLIHRFIADLATSPLMELELGQEIGLEKLVAHLSALAYTRTDLVERRGEFAVRGGIVDIFLPLSDHPVRVDFVGDEIEELSYFEVADQRTIKPVPGALAIYPCRELLLSDEVRARAKRIPARYPAAKEICERLAEGIISEGMESLIPLLVDEQESILRRALPNTEVIFIEQERIRSRTADLIATNQEFLAASWSNAAFGGDAPLFDGQDTYMTWNELTDELAELNIPSRNYNSFGSDMDEETLFLDVSPIEPLRGNTDKAVAIITESLLYNHAVVFSALGSGMAERFADIFRNADLPVRMVGDVMSQPLRGTVYVTTSKLSHGFLSHAASLLFMTERDLSGHKGSGKDGDALPSRRKATIDPLELGTGDYVVHEQHGIGRYVELVHRTVGTITREYLVIEYASAKRGQPGDRIFVPTDSLEQVSKYVGGEAPTVHRIGSGDWQKAKGRARKAVRQIAGELIRLYAARTSSPSFAFSLDTPWQRELEDAFSYVETPDQLSSIEEVKRDMERPYPMDRIICGDVGYGKTEIAIRAAFKAVQDGKQVAVLVPTTLLVQQHTNTFTERYSGFPIKVAGLSRFNTVKESKEVLKDLSGGSVDVIIGTHRLLSADVQFKDLGLVIVDEEQRFGVEQKESLKKMRTTVDVLAMSATPIPRTLEMAVTGIREMSTITTPPEERHPILTYVGPSEELQIAAAIRRELLRDGQVFYIHNRVESIDRAASHLQELIPEARIRVAHGQMSEHMLEDVILDFWEREFDVLVCTTIVESGLDIANANTLIVERADRFGLSQLHQLRGRVGRGRERAYAYFLYPTDQPLTEVALDRLKTIAANTDLGSGMRVALKDLEIRGAGNLLGGEQSGHIADVGFDLYMRMVGEAVQDYKSGIMEVEDKNLECKVELPINAHFSDQYVPGERLRLDLYRRLADVASRNEVDEIRAELIDRFGPLPHEADSLLGVAQLRALAKGAKLTEVVLQGKYLRIGPVKLPESMQLRMTRLYPGSLNKPATNTVLVALPSAQSWGPSSGGAEMVDTSLLTWATEAIETLVNPTTPMKASKT